MNLRGKDVSNGLSDTINQVNTAEAANLRCQRAGQQNSARLEISVCDLLFMNVAHTYNYV